MVADIYLTKSIKLHLEAIPFDSSSHTYAFTDKDCISLIDGKKAFGIDCYIPRTQLVQFNVFVDDTTYSLDVTQMYNPWYGNFDQKFVKMERNRNTITLRVSFGDGAGCYFGEWIVKGKNSYRLELTDDESFISKYF